MSDRERRIVIRWRMRGQAEVLRPTLGSVYPPDETSSFEEALNAIDEAESKVWGDRNLADDPPE